MALTNEEVLWNEALGYVGEYEIEDTSASRLLKQYRLCSRFYASSRDQTLIVHPWNEAMLSIIISQEEKKPVYGYERKFTKPSDSIRIWSVNDSLGADPRLNFSGIFPWDVEGDFIMSNAGQSPPSWATATVYVDGQFVTDSDLTYEVLVSHTSDTIVNDVASGNIISKGGDYKIVYVRYIWQLTDIDKFSPKLREAIAIRLASKVITGLTNDTQGKKDLIAEWETLTMPSARSVDAQQGKPRPIFSSEWLRSRSEGMAGGGWYVV